MSESPEASTPWLVACLCAGWCRTCDAYLPIFEALSQSFGDEVRFVWVDVEDEAQALGDVDIVNFPTLLIARGEWIHFLGAVTPHVQTTRHLVQRAMRGELGRVSDATLEGLPARLNALS